jgi:hypothetical protein
MTKQITWKITKVEVSKIKPTPNNYKLKTEEGLSRFRKSIEKFGLAGTVILNTDLTLIDGNTRWEDAKAKKLKFINATIPDRKLTPKEFVEFSAMYDAARAGEVDITRIKNELGTSDQFFKDWGFTMPPKAVEALKKLEENEPITPRTVNGKQVKPEELATSKLTLMFTKAEADEYLRIAESLYTIFKVDNVTDLSLAALKFVQKNGKAAKK